MPPFLPCCRELRVWNCTSFCGLPWPNSCGLQQKESTLHLVLRLRGGTVIKVKTLTGKEILIDIDIDIEPTDTIDQIKERVEEQEGIPQQRLIYAGKQLADDKTAKDYNLEGGSGNHLVLALRGVVYKYWFFSC
ncbi:hypothetical protein RHSIM_Rhsim04G0004500 [Rhododendron simsii]|uniref:Ubiquitin-like domain-containing protein n=1 Tax=Rhododendron simsii TaxID=118357 RepID=A0A834H2B7_RHOSS|nr:hypothetical protein RHSIM_Rhsim04G0004500 [Rhododendron simsii]